MTTAKQLALAAYYYGSLPARWRRNSQSAARRRAPVMVLFYHRIADHDRNDWTAGKAMFARQMRWLRRHFDMVTMREAQRRMVDGNDRPCVHVSFDDGYADNMEFAIPLLVELKIPCTYFVASQFVARQCPFPHDVARNRPLRPNTPEQLRQMVDWGVEIGAHTQSHANLGVIDDQRLLYDEIVGSKERLEAMTGSSVRYFAFPYGQHCHLNSTAFEIVRRCGMLAACSAYGGYNLPGDDPFHLQRIHADDQMLTLRNWLTFDPRKHRITVRYDFHSMSAISNQTFGGRLVETDSR